MPRNSMEERRAHQRLLHGCYKGLTWCGMGSPEAVTWLL